MNKFLGATVLSIAIITIISGAVQMISPETVLSFIDGEVTKTSAHFFAIVGMFMILFGGLMAHTMYSSKTSKEAIFWCAFQKMGAFGAVSLGVMNDIFAPIAMAVAIFDLFSGLIYLYYAKQASV